MYEPGPSDEELALIGITREDVADCTEQEVWPENWVPFNVFSDMATQWRVGPGGYTGLDYRVLELSPWMPKRDDESYAEVFEAVRVLEIAALKQMSDKR